MKYTRYATVALVALVVLSAAPSVVAAKDVTGHPTLNASAPNNEFAPGSSGTLDLYVQNNGYVHWGGPGAYEQRVQMARGTMLNVSGDGTPLKVHTTSYPAGDVRTGTNGPYPISVTVPAGTEPGKYDLSVTANYDYTSRVRYYGGGTPRYDDSHRTETFTVPVVVKKRATFAVEKTGSNVNVGESGSYSVTLKNTGSEVATSAAVSVSSQSSDLTFGPSGKTATDSVDTWRPNETKTLTYSASVADSSGVHNYSVGVNVDFNDASGMERHSNRLVATLRPRTAKAFSVSAVNTIPAGTRGDTPKGSDWTPLTLQVTNDGTQTVHDVKPSLVFDSQYFERPIESNYRTSLIGTLKPGQTKNVTYAVSAASSAGGTSYPLSVKVNYQSSSGVSHNTKAYTVPVQITASSSLPLLPIGGGAVILAGLLVGGFIWWRRDPEEE